MAGADSALRGAMAYVSGTDRLADRRRVPILVQPARCATLDGRRDDRAVRRRVVALAGALPNVRRIGPANAEILCKGDVALRVGVARVEAAPLPFGSHDGRGLRPLAERHARRRLLAF